MERNARKALAASLALVILAVVYASCSTEKPNVVSKTKDWRKVPRSLQELSKKAMQNPTFVSTPDPGQASLAIEWDNLPSANPGRFFTRLEGSTNLRDWTIITNFPYQVGRVHIDLTNRPKAEFYRAVNGFVTSPY